VAAPVRRLTGNLTRVLALNDHVFYPSTEAALVSNGYSTC
jgi:hypothetical protein